MAIFNAGQFRSRMKKLEREINKVLDNAQFHKGLRAVADAASGDSETTARLPHRIFWLKRKESHEVDEDVDIDEIPDHQDTLYIPTDYIANKVAKQLIDEQDVQRQWFKDLLTTSKLTKSAGGVIYESTFKLMVQRGMTLRLRLLHECTKSGLSAYSSDKCPQCRLKQQAIELIIEEIHSTASFGRADGFRAMLDASTQGWSFWDPKTSNNQSFDCLLLHTTECSNKAYYIQNTISSQHSAKPVPGKYRVSEQDGRLWDEYYVFVCLGEDIHCAKPEAGEGISLRYAQWGQ